MSSININAWLVKADLGAAVRLMWEEQEAYNRMVRSIQPDVTRWDEVYLLGLVGEVNEVLEAINWKRHRRYTHLEDPENVRRELADMTKYLLSLWQTHYFTVEDLVQAVLDKGDELKSELRTEFFPPEHSRIIVTDLDGTVADFRRGWAAFIRSKVEEGELEGWEDASDTLDLSGQLPFDLYHRLKLEFETLREGYRSLPPYEDALTLLRNEHEGGAGVVVITARPADKLQSIRTQTKGWLQDWQIPHNSVHYGRDERILRTLALAAHGNKVLMLEDDPALAKRAAASGITVWLRDQPYNQSVTGPLIRRSKTYPSWIDWDQIKEVGADRDGQ